MTFAQIPAGEPVFLDANTLIYHFGNDPKFGMACTELIEQIEHGQRPGFTSAHVLSDVAHRLMTLEAMMLNGWPLAGIVTRLRQHHDEIPKLSVYRQAIASLRQLKISVLPVTQALVESATLASGHYKLLSGDALIVAVMQHDRIAHLASNDADFDQVPGISRYAPA